MVGTKIFPTKWDCHKIEYPQISCFIIIFPIQITSNNHFDAIHHFRHSQTKDIGSFVGFYLLNIGPFKPGFSNGSIHFGCHRHFGDSITFLLCIVEHGCEWKLMIPYLEGWRSTWLSIFWCSLGARVLIHGWKEGRTWRCIPYCSPISYLYKLWQVTNLN
jgi:hypothetical protein